MDGYTILSLPNEVILMIYNYVGKNEWYHSQLVCKRLAAITISLLLNVPISGTEKRKYINSVDVGYFGETFTMRIEDNEIYKYWTIQPVREHTYDLYARVKDIKEERKRRLEWYSGFYEISDEGNIVAAMDNVEDDDEEANDGSYVSIREHCEDSLSENTTEIDLVTMKRIYSKRQSCMRLQPCYAAQMVNEIISKRLKDVHNAKTLGDIWNCVLSLAVTLIQMGLYDSGSLIRLVKLSSVYATPEQLRMAVSSMIMLYGMLKSLL